MGVQRKSGYLDLTAHALRENRKLENFALTKAGEDRNFRLKTEQKSIIEDVVCLFVCLFVFYTIC